MDGWMDRVRGWVDWWTVYGWIGSKVEWMDHEWVDGQRNDGWVDRVNRRIMDGWVQ
jgi:hypothetical protein